MPRTATALIWSPAAQRDIARLHAFLQSENPSAANKAILCIRKAALSLADFPSLGKKLEGRPDREIFINFGKNGYILRYRLDGATPVILRIWHALEHRRAG